MPVENETGPKDNMKNQSPLIDRRRPSLKLIAVVIWLVLSLALAGWWLLFGLQQLDKIAGLQNATAHDILRQHRMLMSEGGFLFALLLIGGVSLLYYILIEVNRAKQLQTFFATFTHDLKTSLASLRLQAEALEEDLKDQPNKLTKRIIKDTVRLELQLNNSLILAQNDNSRLFFEEVSLKKSLEHMKIQWSELEVEIKSDCSLMVDSRALESICKNIIQNALIHGQARTLVVRCKAYDLANVQIDFLDDGKGFQGKTGSLSKLFVRHSTTSGTGIGLYLVRNLCERMGGSLEFGDSDQGFLVSVILPGKMK